jgi:hypothetical protein
MLHVGIPVDFPSHDGQPLSVGEETKLRVPAWPVPFPPGPTAPVQAIVFGREIAILLDPAPEPERERHERTPECLSRKVNVAVTQL